MRLHKFCSLFPALIGKDFDELVDDIRENGLREKLKTFNGELLDGWCLTSRGQ